MECDWWQDQPDNKVEDALRGGAGVRLECEDELLIGIGARQDYELSFEWTCTD